MNIIEVNPPYECPSVNTLFQGGVDLHKLVERKYKKSNHTIRMNTRTKLKKINTDRKLFKQLIKQTNKTNKI